MKNVLGRQYRLMDHSDFAFLQEGLIVTAEEIDKHGVLVTFDDEGCFTFEKVTHERFLRYFELYEPQDEPSKPTHYDTGIDTIAFMRANCPPEQVEGFLRGNALKYLQRYDKKNGVDDLKKAAHYVQMLIEELEG